MSPNSDLKPMLMEDKGMEMLADIGRCGNASKVTLSDCSTTLRYIAYILNQIMKSLLF